MENMRIIENSALLGRYLDAEPYINYFREYLHPYTRIFEYEPGEIVLEQDAPPTYLFLMVFGRCCVRVLLANGKSVILQTLRAPCLIGEMELLRKVPSFTVQALERSRMLAIPLNPCGSYLLEDAYFLRHLCADLICKERVEAYTLLHSFAYPTENRLAKFILDNRQGNDFYIKKVLVAESLGVSYRHIEKVMSDFVDRHYLSKQKLVYTIQNERALTDLAQELSADDLTNLC